MVVPYQMWMLQRLHEVIEACVALPENRSTIEDFLGGFKGGSDLLELGNLISGCRVQKKEARLFSAEE